MSAVCPRCGVAVTPGYVRCPKCRAPLPRRATTTTSAGGTAVGGGGRPVAAIAIAGGALVVGVILYFALRGGGSKVAASPAPEGSATTAPAAPGPAAAPAPTPGPAPATAPAPAARGPTPEAVASELERALKRKHLWSTVSAIGDHLDVRSGSCRDPGMGAELVSIAAQGKAAGLLRLRCLEESGTVVMERDL
jgi:hypothetical protein